MQVMGGGDAPASMPTRIAREGTISTAGGRWCPGCWFDMGIVGRRAAAPRCRGPEEGQIPTTGNMIALRRVRACSVGAKPVLDQTWRRWISLLRITRHASKIASEPASCREP